MKQLWVLAGGNGAGKSTFYELALRPLGVPFINADMIAKEYFPNDPEGKSYHAAQLAEKLRFDQLAQGSSFCFETVFSHPSKIDFIGQAKALGYSIVLVVIHVSSGSLNLARVAQRVEEGGHSVPSEKVLARIPRMLENVAAAIPLCDDVRVLDNSRLDAPYQKILTIRGDQRIIHVEKLPDWAVNFY
jgi:predicted ABC-type ATPase